MGERADQINRADPDDFSSTEQGAFMQKQVGADDQADQDDTADIRAGIDQTRAEMSETIDAIQDRLSPQHIKEQVKEQVREQFQDAKATVRDATIGKAEDMVRSAGETVNEARYTIGETIRQNPIPAAMVGLGLGWLFMNRQSAGSRRSTRYQYSANQPYYAGRQSYGGSYYDDRYDLRSSNRSYQGQRSEPGALHRVQETAGNVASRAQETVSDFTERAQETVGSVASKAQETVGDVASRAQETVSDFTERAQETAGHIADQAQYQAQRLEDRFQQALYSNPLAVAAATLALGAAVGLAVPQTRKEHELMGEARDNLMDKVQTVAQDTMEKVQRVAGDVIEEAQTTVQQAAKEQGLAKE